MNATTKKTATQDKPISEQLHEIKHLIKILVKGQEQIKAHLWVDSREEKLKHPKGLAGKKEQELQRQEAINYINNIVVPELKARGVEQGEIGVQGLGDWVVAQLATPVFNWMKTQALYYITEGLKELRKKAIPYAVETADWVLDKLEDFIIEKLKEASEEDKEAFKEAIKEHFPNSRLNEKLS